MDAATLLIGQYSVPIWLKWRVPCCCSSYGTGMVQESETVAPTMPVGGDGSDLTAKGSNTMSLTIGKRITLGFAAAVVITTSLGLFSYVRLNGIEAEANSVVLDSLPGEALAGQIEAMSM